MNAWAPPNPAEYATRWPDSRNDGDLESPWLCCGLPWVTPLHAPHCPARCPVCGSEGHDNDHRDTCATIGTCAQFLPTIDQPWHPLPDPVNGDRTPGELAQWIAVHIVEEHPDARVEGRWFV